MSDVEEIREAARLMRRAADAASDGPWAAYCDHRSAHYARVVDADDNDLSGCPDCGTRGEYEDADAVHIASWHPAVARAVADWLDGVRVPSDPHTEAEAARCGCGDCANYHRALRVVRAYLGRSS